MATYRIFGPSYVKDGEVKSIYFDLESDTVQNVVDLVQSSELLFDETEELGFIPTSFIRLDRK